MTSDRFIWKNIARFGGLAALCAAISLFSTTAAHTDEPATKDASESEGRPVASGNKHRVPIEVARDRAQLLHNVYASTLDTLHHHYFHGDRAVVPARAMKDVFAEMREQSGIEARWISVNLKAMSFNHEPSTDFEKKAARELAKGDGQIDEIEGGYYRHAAAIPLTAGCVSCHGGFFRTQEKTPRFAGLIISIPVKE